MATNRRYTVKFRRSRIRKTDYRLRLKLLLSRKNRLVIRKSLNKIYLQLIKYEVSGDKVLFSLNSSGLRKYGWKYKLNNMPACYLTGLLFGLEAKKRKFEEAVLDIGMNISVAGSSLYSALKGVVDAGLLIPHNEKILPNEERIAGKHITDYTSLLKKEPEQYKKQFSSYLNKNADPEEMSKSFNETKQKILKEYENN